MCQIYLFVVFEILEQNKFRRDKRRKRKEDTGVNTLETSAEDNERPFASTNSYTPPGISRQTAPYLLQPDKKTFGSCRVVEKFSPPENKEEDKGYPI